MFVIVAFLLCEFFLIRMLRESVACEKNSEAIRSENKPPMKNENLNDLLKPIRACLPPDRQQAPETKKADHIKKKNEKKDTVKK